MLKSIFYKMKELFDKNGGIDIKIIKLDGHYNEQINKMLENNFISHHILRNILHNYHSSYLTKIDNINLWITTDNRIVDRDLIYKLIKRITVIRELLRLKNKNNINVFLWPTSEKKKFPISKHKILGVDEINSACTFVHPDKYGPIFIWRKEEVKKVLIHELLHSFRCDYHMYDWDHKIKKYFNVKSHINVNESYVETLANIFNCMLTTIENDDNYTKCRINMNNELKYSCGRVSKILKYNGIKDLKQLTINEKKYNNKFKQKTSVFSYYILKTALLNNLEEFLKMVLRFNHYICPKNYEKKYFQLVIYSFSNMENKMYKIKSHNNQIILKDSLSLKMTYN